MGYHRRQSRRERDERIAPAALPPLPWPIEMYRPSPAAVFRTGRIAIVVALVFATGAALAGEAPRPPRLEPLPEPPPQSIGFDADPASERGVRISPRAGDAIEETTVDGRRVIRVHTPGGGQYVIREDLGDGTYARQTPGDTGVRVPMWVIVEF